MPEDTTTTAAGDALRVRREQDGDRATLTLEGEVDIGTSRVALDALEVALARGAREVEIDLGPVTFIDSSGLSAIVASARRVHDRGATLRTRVPKGHEARVLIDLAGLESVLALTE